MRKLRFASRLIPVGLAAVFLTSCGGGSSDSSSQPTTREAVYRGRYSNGFEANSFVPCGTGEAWWTTGVKDARIPYDYSPVYVEVKGTLSEPGQYGQNGAYKRMLTVREVSVLQQDIPTTCP